MGSGANASGPQGEDMKELPSAGECGMDFGRCQCCSSIRWITPRSLEVCGIHCNHCGSGIITDAFQVSWWERPALFYWFMWEMNQMNLQGWWKDIRVLAQALWMATHPKIEQYDRGAEPPRGEVGNEAG